MYIFHPPRIILPLYYICIHLAIPSNALTPLHHLKSSPANQYSERSLADLLANAYTGPPPIPPENRGLIDPRLFVLQMEADKFPLPIELDLSTEGNIYACDEDNAPGQHMIYCDGPLLEAVMKSGIYGDSKTFVDRPMKHNRTGGQILADFNERFPSSGGVVKAELESFIDDNFDDEGHELDSCDLTDWVEYPEKIMDIKDYTYRNFARKLHKIWPGLCRKVSESVWQEPSRYSLLPVPEQFIIPGGRFREFYYWDAYWIVRGLLVSGMNETARSMIRNFAYMVERYGFVPNGGRVYYLKRSQPPLLAPMVYEYYRCTKDIGLIREVLPILEREYQFWQHNRSVEVNINGENITVYQYRTPTNTPRPESYREDMSLAKSIIDREERKKLFQNVASAAESGWDFSTRWMGDGHTLQTIETTNILPVDLNSYICYNSHIISYLHAKLGNNKKSSMWMRDHMKFQNGFKKVFYVPTSRGWYDYNMRTQKHNTDFYPSIATPLFTQCYDVLSDAEAVDLYDQLDDMGAFNFSGGIPTSMKKDSHEQWDFPNGWSPLNHMVIEGLRKSNNARLQAKAFELAQRWLLRNIQVYKDGGIMWEKYDVNSRKARTGKGGEYSVQWGFGWTNGVALDLMSAYGDRLRFPTIHPPVEPLPPSLREKSESAASPINIVSHCIIALISFLCLYL